MARAKLKIMTGNGKHRCGWFELGGASQDESRQASGLLARTSALRQDVRRVWVKVEEIK